MGKEVNTNDSGNLKKPKKVFKGYIERIRGEMLVGWAIDENNDSPIPITVLTGEKEIGKGIADIERDDLRLAGIHQGKHGFRIELDDEIKLVDTLEIRLLHAETFEPIKHNKFLFNKPEEVISGQIEHFKHGHIVANIKAESSVGIKDVTLCDNNGDLGTLKVDIGPNSAKVSFPLSASKQDGRRRLYRLIVEGYPFLIASELLLTKSVKTPWQYLKDSFNEPGFLSLPPQADHRYESLKLQLDAINKKNTLHTVENLTGIHSLLVESYHGRTKFPAFDLPKFSKPRVSIIVPAYNKFELTYHCIASIAFAFNKTSYEVILADDCSTDETSEAEEIIGNLKVSRNPENLRFLRSCNRASSLATGEFIVFLNNDTEVTSYWLDELVNKMDESSEIGMVGSKLLHEDGSLQEAGGIVWRNGNVWNVGRDSNPASPEFNYSREVDYLTGASMCIRRSIWNEVGQFSEEFVPCYYEDTDLAFKVRSAGHKTVYVPHSVVMHFEGKSHGKDLSSGLKRFQKINEKIFREKWFKHYRNGKDANLNAMSLEKDRNVDQRILVLDHAVPTPNKDAGSYAAIQEMKLMQELGFKVTFVPENMAHLGKYTKELQRMGIEVLYAPFYVSVVDVLQKRLKEMSGVYITRYNVAEKYLDTIRSISNVPIIFNNADLHFLRQLRNSLMGGVNEEGVEKAMETRGKELAVCEKVDAILCYNTTEHAVITSHILEAEKLHLTPWVLEQKSNAPSFDEREGISFLGGYSHFPNVEAVEYLYNEIMPLLLQKRPDIVLYVYGSNMPENFRDYEGPNIKIVGFAEHLDDVFHKHKAFVAPLLSGAGIKGKVLESMAYGVPSVLTGVAAEGTGLSSGISTQLAEKPEQWVDSIIKLYDEKDHWMKLSENALTIAETDFSKENAIKRFKDIFSSVGIYSARRI
ncbi:glycosyltransferase [Alteromonas stellipolaris]|uniref:glycosyltransferase n=1 Tax=Alteromonas stellipolaris TaxID=233316 RepID=UPI001DBCBE03|nr:glycosyltransferase [Alteromonas stellipolaris]MBZ2163620.1 glycosyltransferase [Alteromonas stellipolaris]